VDCVAVVAAFAPVAGAAATRRAASHEAQILTSVRRSILPRRSLNEAQTTLGLGDRLVGAAKIGSLVWSLDSDSAQMARLRLVSGYDV
jgi:hypothetical protein